MVKIYKLLKPIIGIILGIVGGITLVEIIEWRKRRMESLKLTKGLILD